MRPSSCNKRKDGFTLVELLVAVGIIAVLLALLMPALNKVRGQARTVTCLSNLRQLGAAFQIYLNENRGRSLQQISQTGPLEMEDILLRDRPKGVQSPVVFCPETTEGPVLVLGGGVSRWYPGGTFRPWGYPDTRMIEEFTTAPFRGSSYGMNAWLVHVGPAMDPSTGMRREEYIHLPAKMSDRIPLFADGTEPRGWPRHDDPPPRSLVPHRPGDQSLYSISRIFCIPRHGRAINVVFLDGHARTVPLAELWQLKWNNLWVSTNVQMPPK